MSKRKRETAGDLDVVHRAKRIFTQHSRLHPTSADPETVKSLISNIFKAYQAQLLKDHDHNTIVAAATTLADALQGQLPGQLLAAALLPRLTLRHPTLHAVALAPLTTLATTSDTTLISYLKHMAPWALSTIPAALVATLTASLSSLQDKRKPSVQQAGALDAVLQCMGRQHAEEHMDAQISDQDAVAMIQAAPESVVLACLRAACNGDSVSPTAAGGRRVLTLLVQPAQAHTASSGSNDASSNDASSNLLLQLLQTSPSLHTSLASALQRGPSAPAAAAPLVHKIRDILPPLPATTTSSQPRQWSPVRQPSQGAAPQNTAVAASRRSRFDVEPEEGEAPLEASSHRHSRPPSAAGVPDFDSITRVAPASRCVWLHGVPRRLSMTAIGDECSRYGSVAAVLPGQEPDEAVVVFTTIRHAVRGYEALLGSRPWGIWDPLDAGFCADEQRGAPRPPRDASPNCGVWVAGCCDAATEAAVLGLVREARLMPDEVLRVRGAGPGVMALYAHPLAARDAIDCLGTQLMGPGGPRRPPPVPLDLPSRGASAAPAVQTTSATASHPAPVHSSASSGRPVDAQSLVLWTGHVAKSGTVQCKVQVLRPSPQEQAMASAAEAPEGWPAVLDVQFRASISSVVGKDVYEACSPAERTVVRMMAAPGNPADAKGFAVFCRYLGDKQRAGVVKGLSGGRTAYLIPHSAEVCKALSVPVEPVCMLMLIVHSGRK